MLLGMVASPRRVVALASRNRTGRLPASRRFPISAYAEPSTVLRDPSRRAWLERCGTSRRSRDERSRDRRNRIGREYRNARMSFRAPGRRAGAVAGSLPSRGNEAFPAPLHPECACAISSTSRIERGGGEGFSNCADADAFRVRRSFDETELEQILASLTCAGPIRKRDGEGGSHAPSLLSASVRPPRRRRIRRRRCAAARDLLGFFRRRCLNARSPRCESPRRSSGADRSTNSINRCQIVFRQASVAGASSIKAKSAS